MELEPIDPKAGNVRRIVDSEVQAFVLMASPKIKRLIHSDLRWLEQEVLPGDASYIKAKLATLPVPQKTVIWSAAQDNSW